MAYGFNLKIMPELLLLRKESFAAQRSRELSQKKQLKDGLE
jgi:hypothetical protein